ncbi:Cupredoxin [Elaphomyces granulatus]
MSMIRSLVVGALLASAVSAKTINVKVGDGSLTYSPNSTKAEVGDEVAFIFYPLNHTVNQASFSNPCIPLKDGFFSGFINSSSGPASNEFVITVKDTSPIWFYCGQAAHCENGMVGVINEPTAGNKTLEAFASNAKNVGKSENPDKLTGGKIQSLNKNNSTSPPVSSPGSSSYPSGSPAAVSTPGTSTSNSGSSSGSSSTSSATATSTKAADASSLSLKSWIVAAAAFVAGTAIYIVV